MNTIARAEVPGQTKVNTTQTVVLIALSIITVWTLYMVPSWHALGDPFLLAAVAGAVTVACLWLTRWLGSRATKFERAWLAAFLVGMPLVYVMGWFAARGHAASSWIWVELLGLAIFAAFAALGLKNSLWFLAIGIAGHGLYGILGTTKTISNSSLIGSPKSNTSHARHRPLESAKLHRSKVM